MDEVQLRPGLYTNVFPVTLPAEPFAVMVIERAQATDLKALRTEIERSSASVKVYAHRDRVYGYGQDAAQFLSPKKFTEETVHLMKVPALGARLVVDGIIALAQSKEFWLPMVSAPKGVEARTKIFRQQPAGVIAQGEIQIFAGYDLHCVYYPLLESLGLIVDVVWTYRDRNKTPLSTRQMWQRNALGEARVVQEEILPGTNRVNQQISQIRMHRYLLPFAQEFAAIPLFGGGEARITPVPFQVIL
jgi:hypothetical protein